MYPHRTLLLLALFGLFTLPNVLAQNAPPPYPAGDLDQLVYEWTRARDYTQAYLDQMPEEGMGFKPTPEIRSFAEQMLHLAAANYFFASGIFGVPNPREGQELEKMDALKTKAALTATVLESYNFMIEAVRTAGAASLSEQATVFGMSRPRQAFLAAAFEHQTHHRGQTTIYLRLKGTTPPQERLF
jgi:uncharacterized damage-inducible protein DinB